MFVSGSGSDAGFFNMCVCVFIHQNQLEALPRSTPVSPPTPSHSQTENLTLMTNFTEKVTEGHIKITKTIMR